MGGHPGCGVRIEPADPASDPVRALIAELDAYQSRLYPPESNHLDPVESLCADNVYFVCARSAGQAVGCGAVKRHGAGYGEMKRLYVKPAFRGRGISRLLVQALEAHLRAAGVARICLETGIHQSEALGLYAALGYRRRGPFGDYRRDPLSVFMEKCLARD